MKALLTVELFNHERDRAMRVFTRAVEGRSQGAPRPWVAELIGEYASGKFQRAFLDGQLDYRHANGAGSRGVRKLYVLESARAYEVNKQVSWRRWDRFFCCVTDAGEIVEISEAEVRTIIMHREIDEQVEQWKTGKSH